MKARFINLIFISVISFSIFSCAKSYRNKDIPKLNTEITITLRPAHSKDLAQSKNSFLYLSEHLQKINDASFQMLSDDSLDTVLVHDHMVKVRHIDIEGERSLTKIDDLKIEMGRDQEEVIPAKDIYNDTFWYLEKNTRDAEYKILFQVVDYIPQHSLKLKYIIKSFSYK